MKWSEWDRWNSLGLFIILVNIVWFLYLPNYGCIEQGILVLLFLNFVGVGIGLMIGGGRKKA